MKWSLVRPPQPGLHRLRTMIPGNVDKQVGHPFARIHRLDRHLQHDRAGSIHCGHLQHSGLAGLKVDRAVNVQALATAGLRHGRLHGALPTAATPFRAISIRQIDVDAVRLRSPKSGEKLTKAIATECWHNVPSRSSNLYRSPSQHRPSLGRLFTYCVGEAGHANDLTIGPRYGCCGGSWSARAAGPFRRSCRLAWARRMAWWRMAWRPV
jgi:hypothetical protein